MITEFMNFDLTQSGLWSNILSGAYSKAYHMNKDYTILSVGTANVLAKLLQCLATDEIMIAKTGKRYIHAIRVINSNYYFLLTRLQLNLTYAKIDSLWDSSEIDLIDSYLSRYFLMDSFYSDLHCGNYGMLGKHIFCFDAYKPSGMSYQTHKYNTATEIEKLCAENNIPISR